MEKHDGHETQGRQEILMGERDPVTGRFPKSNAPARGAGHGGPATGASVAPLFNADNQPPGAAKSAGKEVAAEIRAKIAARKDDILEAQLARAMDVLHPAGHAAAVDLLNRIAPPESKQTIAGDPDAPLGFTIVTGVPRAED